MFHNIKGVAFASDTVIDLIPMDVVTSLVIAAAASGTSTAASGYPGGRARVYHAASAESHPVSITTIFEFIQHFYTTNPSPLRLPMARYATGGDS